MAERTGMRAIRGIELFERRIGEGPPTVVLHGGPGAHHDYLLPGFDLLATGRELIYYDQRGGGRSPVSREVELGWREHVADLEALRELWGVERLDLAGYSWGGLLAMLYATEHPGRVARLALVSPAPAWRAGREEFEARFAARSRRGDIAEARRELAESGLKERDPTRYQRRTFELAVAGYFHDWTRVSDLTPFRITGRTQTAVWESLGDYDLRSGLQGLDLPALVVHGEDDPIPIETAEVAARLLRARLVRVADCGHVPFVEQPAAFVAALDPFLARREA